MIKTLFLPILLFFNLVLAFSQESIPLDTVHLDINARSHMFENYKGQQTIYLQGGTITLKDVSFLNGTIEYDLHLKETRAFPGVYFRVNDSDSEYFYIRPHQAGNPDANQATPVTKGITPWQFYFGPKYSFPYVYKLDDWTHVKIVVQNKRAQVYLDYSEEPNLSWELFHEPKVGGVSFSGGRDSGLHLANIKVTHTKQELTNFNPGKREPLEGLVSQWELSDKFEEKELANPLQLQNLLDQRKWGKKIVVEEGVAANISRAVQLRDDHPGNTVFARLVITSDKDQTKLFEFGYSDRVVALLNNHPIYKGTNGFQTRDYRYLGTIGLFDAIYLDLKKGKNTLLLAISEDFGGWLVTGRFVDPTGLKVN